KFKGKIHYKSKKLFRDFLLNKLFRTVNSSHTKAISSLGPLARKLLGELAYNVFQSKLVWKLFTGRHGMIVDPRGLREILLERFLAKNHFRALYYYSIEQLLLKVLLKQCAIPVDSGGIL